MWMGAKKPFPRPSLDVVPSYSRALINNNSTIMHFIYFILFEDSLSYKFLCHFISILEQLIKFSHKISEKPEPL